MTSKQVDRMQTVAAMTPAYDAAQDDALIAIGLAYEEDGITWPVCDARGRAIFYLPNGSIKPYYLEAAA